jgi:type IV pilus assembly protein PilE
MRTEMKRKRAIFKSLVHHSGFTLVELMITVVILAIIVGIAVPSYQAQIRKARRTDARNAMLDIAAREERYLSIANSYSAAATDVGYTGAWPQAVSNNYYNVTVAAPPLAVPPSFLITATAINAQTADLPCQTFTLDQIGTQTAKDSANVDNSTVCWGN